MPFVTCPNCRMEQTVPREMVGLATPCRRCGVEITVTKAGSAALAPRRVRAVPAAGEPVTLRTVALTAGLIAFLVGVVAFALAIVIWTTRDGKPGGRDVAAQVKPAVTPAQPNSPPPRL